MPGEDRPCCWLPCEKWMLWAGPRLLQQVFAGGSQTDSSGVVTAPPLPPRPSCPHHGQGTEAGWRGEEGRGPVSLQIRGLRGMGGPGRTWLRLLPGTPQLRPWWTLVTSWGQCWPELSSLSCRGYVPGVRSAGLTAPSPEAASPGGETATSLRTDIAVLLPGCAYLSFGDLAPAPSRG